MNLPFTQQQFFEVFAAYNVAVWPAQFVLTLLAVAMVVLVIRGPERAGRLVSYGLALLWAWMALAGYPAIGEYIGHRYPAAPTFGLPCPTTLSTFGILLMAAPGLRKAMVVAPLAWAVIGSIAAFALGVTQDLGLVVVAMLGVYLLVRPASRVDDSPQA